MKKARVAAYRHYLGAWSGSDRVSIGDRAADDAELAALGAGDVIGDAASLAKSDVAVIAAFTVPKRVRKRLWALDWDDEGASPRDPAAFQAYGRSVAAFLRGAGVPVADAPEMRLVAGGPGANAVDDLARHPASVVALVNVGESDVLVTTTNIDAKSISLRVPPDEGCLVSPKARPYVLTVPTSAEFGLLLEIA